MDIYTDGACHSSTKIGGIGVVFVKNNKIIYKFNKQFTDTTNNKMEILAIIYALHAISKPIDIINIYSDSQYTIGCLPKIGLEKRILIYGNCLIKYMLKLKPYVLIFNLTG